MNKEYVILGAGPLGLAVMDELHQRGKKVSVISKSGKALVPDEVKSIKCDVNNLDELKKELQYATVIYHCLGLPYQHWESQFPTMMNNIIQIAKETGAKIIYGDNLYCYGPQENPFHEEMNYKPVGKKTKIRAEVATSLMNAANAGVVKATIGRGSDFFGPRANNAMLGDRVINHMLNEKPVELIGNPDTTHSHIYIKDFARGLVILGENDSALGEIWHIPHPEPTTTRYLVEHVANRLNKKPKYRLANKFIVTVGGLFNSDMKEFKELMYQQVNEFTVNSEKFTDKYEFNVTPYEDALEETVDWYLKEHQKKSNVS